jgi:hypothetical protein
MGRNPFPVGTGLQILVLSVVISDHKRAKKSRARWGASGALSLTIRYSEVEFLAEAVLFLACVLVSGDES